MRRNDDRNPLPLTMSPKVARVLVAIVGAWSVIAVGFGLVGVAQRLAPWHASAPATTVATAPTASGAAGSLVASEAKETAEKPASPSSDDAHAAVGSDEPALDPDVRAAVARVAAVNSPGPSEAAKHLIEVARQLKQATAQLAAASDPSGAAADAAATNAATAKALRPLAAAGDAATTRPIAAAGDDAGTAAEPISDTSGAIDLQNVTFHRRSDRLIAYFTIANRGASPAHGEVSGLATFVPDDGSPAHVVRAALVETPPPAASAPAMPAALPYRARATSQKSLVFWPPAGVRGRFDTVQLFATDARDAHMIAPKFTVAQRTK